MSKKTDTEEKVYGQFAVKAVNDNGAELRIVDEKGNMRFVGRNKSANKDFEVGQVVEMVLRVVTAPPVPAKTVIEVPTEEVPEGAKVIEQ